jgi:hypothetical protein
MDFSDAERGFRELRRRLDAGEIDEREFEAELRRLQVLDGQGRYWMIGAQSGLWYYYDGERWVQGEPSVEPVAAFTQAPPPVPPSAPPSVRSGPPVPERRRKGSSLVVPVVVAVVALCCDLGVHLAQPTSQHARVWPRGRNACVARCWHRACSGADSCCVG